MHYGCYGNVDSSLHDLVMEKMKIGIYCYLIADILTFCPNSTISSYVMAIRRKTKFSKNIFKKWTSQKR